MGIEDPMTKQVWISYFIRNYKDEVLFDVLSMDACCLLLKRPRTFNKDVIDLGKPTMYSFGFEQQIDVQF